MKSYFKAEVKYLKPDEGTDEMKEVTEQYLFQADSYTDAESQVYAKMEEIIPGETFLVNKIEKMQLNGVINPEGEYQFWLAKTVYSYVNNKGVEKKVAEKYLVNASSIDKATKSLTDHLSKDTMLESRILGMAETAILEVFNVSGIEQAVRQFKRDMKALNVTVSVNDNELIEQSVF